MNEIVERAVRLASRGRALLGIAGAPGAGKTTLAERLAVELRAVGVRAAHVPMDGFHLADVALDELGLRSRKGAIETFDVDGYLALLRRLRTASGIVYAPAFERIIEQPIAGSIGVPADADIVISEGNYLLASVGSWVEVRAAFDEVWFAHVDDAVRLERLHARHVRFGKTLDEASTWIETVDEPNARSILATQETADLTVDVDTMTVLA